MCRDWLSVAKKSHYSHSEILALFRCIAKSSEKTRKKAIIASQKQKHTFSDFTSTLVKPNFFAIETDSGFLDSAAENNSAVFS